MNELITVLTENQTIQILRKRRQLRPTDPTRAPKRLESCPAQVFMNVKYSYQKLENMLAANIRPGDIVGVLTYDDEHLPGSRRDVQQDFSYFTRKFRKLRLQSNADPPRYLWSIERSHEDGVHRGRRWHIHFALRSSGNDYDDLHKCWTKGVVLLARFSVNPSDWTRDLGIKSKILSKSDRGYEPLARYMCKEQQDQLGQRTWSYSRSCLKPDIDRVDVESDIQLYLPDGCELVSRMVDASQYDMIKYINRQIRGSPSRRTVYSS